MVYDQSETSNKIMFLQMFAVVTAKCALGNDLLILIAKN